MKNFLWGKVVIYQKFFVPLQRFLKIMSTFIGNIEVRADEKGRIFVPAGYRKLLSEMASKRIVMRRDIDNACLIFYPESVWNEKVSALRAALDEWDPDDQLLLMQFMSDAEILEPDNQGRILLQKRNLECLTDGNERDGKKAESNELVFVGMYDRFALWKPEVYAAKRLDQRELAVRIRERMKK